MYRVEVRYDECGTQANYANNHTEIIFSNALSSRKDFTGKINIESRVTNTFECHFNAIMTVDDVNGAGSGGPGCDNGLVDCNDNGKDLYSHFFLKFKIGQEKSFFIFY